MTDRRTDKAKSDILQLVSPGTPLRDGIDNVLRANTGGLIVVGYNEKVKAIVDGGFKIGCPCTPSFLYELAKMDGAIILNETGEKIILANAQLAPDPAIPSTETGMRHRTAERVAKETRSLVIAISQRRNVITLYQGNFRYALKDIGVILTKANQAIETLEKYKAVLQESIDGLSDLEFEEIVTFSDLLQVLQRFVMFLRIKSELLSYLTELGIEGRLIRLQMIELISSLEKEEELIIRDYAQGQVKEVKNKLQELSQQEFIEDTTLLKVMGYTGYVHLDESITPRGYRMLHKIPRLPHLIIENLVDQFKNFSTIIKASVEELDDVEGIGEVRAKKIKEGLRQLKNQLK
ncbi:DNA integrity scanning diadenylate cyclase DisA [Peribacillus alkalitolerans]|uniref:DNA integrity scanning diadenylate cyclase DisA n=1 Tax=Peribacillus alkalitolerans TaxID=1550385 RepID=UPI0013CFE527|nr:DNA integrity scanning diadenylate cyclase DisA [Peribacillus alkalitolerans]